MATLFPLRAKRGDPENGYLTVQSMVEFLRDAFDRFTGTISRGQATVLAGNTTVVVALTANIGAVYSVAPCPLADPGGRWWVSGKTSSQFIINLGVAAPVGGIAFDWTAKGA